MSATTVERSLHKALAEHGLSSCKLSELMTLPGAYERTCRTITKDGKPIRLDSRGNPATWSAKSGWELIRLLDNGLTLDAALALNEVAR